MKWIKTSERLPKLGDYYYCKVDTKQDSITRTIVEFGDHKNGEFTYQDWDLKNVAHFGDFGEDAEVIEWLDESSSPAGMEDDKMTEQKLIGILKKVSLFDLSDCVFEFIFDNEDGEMCVNANENGRVVDAIIYDGNIFHMMNNDGGFYPLNPMIDAFKLLIHPQSHSRVGESGLYKFTERGFEKLIEEDGWIGVDKIDKLPENGKRVLVITSSGLMEVGYLLSGEWERNSTATTFKNAGYQVTYHRLLPPPPQIKS